MKRLLDTNVLIHAQRGEPAAVRRRLKEQSPGDLAISVVTIAELWYGARRSAAPDMKRSLWSCVAEPYEVLPFDRAAAELHADLRHELRHAPIGERDLLIAATAGSHARPPRRHAPTRARGQTTRQRQRTGVMSSR